LKLNHLNLTVDEHGAWTFYFQATGGFTIEVLC
jgi:hypothetical protein